jgi:hypothetical protein
MEVNLKVKLMNNIKIRHKNSFLIYNIFIFRSKSFNKKSDV